MRPVAPNSHAAAYRFPAGMADIDRVDDRVVHQAADQADDAIGGENARGGIGRRRRPALSTLSMASSGRTYRSDRCHQDDPRNSKP